MTEITDAAIPVDEFQADYRVDEGHTIVGVLCVDLITHIKREEGAELTKSSGELSPCEDRDQRPLFEVPLLGDADTDTYREVAVDGKLHPPPEN